MLALINSVGKYANGQSLVTLAGGMGMQFEFWVVSDVYVCIKKKNVQNALLEKYCIIYIFFFLPTTHFDETNISKTFYVILYSTKTTQMNNDDEHCSKLKNLVTYDD